MAHARLGQASCDARAVALSVLELVLSAVGLLGVVVVARSVWRSPIWAVALVVLSVPLQAYGRVGSDGVGITWTQAWLWTFLAAATILFAAGFISFRVDLISFSFSFVVVCYIVSRHAAVDAQAWRNEVYRWSITLAFFVVARGMLRDRPKAGPLVVVTIMGAIWTGVVAIAQVLGEHGPESFRRAGFPRAFASFGEPNTYGAFAAGCLVVLAAILLFDRSRSSSWRPYSCALGCWIAAVGVGLSQSRGAILATSLVLGTMLIFRLNQSGWFSSSARVVLVVTISAASMIAAPRLAAEVTSGGTGVEVTSASWADQERLAHWGAASRMIVESRGVGIGAGQFDAQYRALTPSWRFRIPQGHSHSAYLQVAAEAGMLGVGAYAVLLLSVFGSLGRRIRQAGSSLTAVLALVATGVFALQNLVDYLHVLNLPIILVAWWALALGQSEGSTVTS